MDENLLEIINYKGNEENFRKLRKDLRKEFKFEILYDDKKNIKYKGQLENGKYNGRGILYYDGKIEYNGYFKDNKYEGFGQKYYYGKEELEYEGFFKNDYYYKRGIKYENNKKIFEFCLEKKNNNYIGIEYFPNGNIRKKMKYKLESNYYFYPLENSYGVLYDNKNNVTYTGILENENPEKINNITLYSKKGNKIYKGDFSSFKYNGKGILYYKEKDKKFFEGFFIFDSYEKGILYDPNENIIYEGEFINNIPKEAKNIKLYNIDGNLIYEGSFFNGKYNGYGKLYDYSHKLIYEGNFKNNIYEGKGILYEREENTSIKIESEFKNGKIDGYGKIFNEDYLYYEGNLKNYAFEGKGILYYQNGQKFYEGYFVNGIPFGNGIKYYKNGAKKFEGIFETLNSLEGKYYSPEKKQIYIGKIINGIPFGKTRIVIYDDNTKKIYEGDINKGKYEGKGIEYSPIISNLILYEGDFFNNYYIEKNLININKNDNENCLSIKMLTAEDSRNHYSNLDLIGKIKGNYINNSIRGEELYNFEYHINNYQLKIEYEITFYKYKTQINPNFSKFAKFLYRFYNIVIFIIDLKDNINEDYISKISEERKFLFFLVCTYFRKEGLIDIINLYKMRKKAEILIFKGIIDKWFEIDFETGEGIKEFKKYLEIESAIIINNKIAKKQNIVENRFNPFIEKKMKYKLFNLFKYLKN